MFNLEEQVLQAAKNAGVEIDSVQACVISDHLEYVLETNKKLNLTAITDVDQALLLHVEDCLHACEYVRDCAGGQYLDMGSGGGYPGIPVAVVTGRYAVLLDSSKKKMAALDTFLNERGLSQRINTSSLRAEELAIVSPGAFSCITARALSSLPSLLELAEPLLCHGGRLICLKGVPDEDELNSAAEVERLLGFSLVKSVAYALSDATTRRSIYVYEKTSKSSVNLPRKVGMAQKRPLV